MALKRIFEIARGDPGRLAISYREYNISYGEFAFWIAEARRFLSQQQLRIGSTAVLVHVPCRLDGWAMDFALRSLGLDTIAVRAPEELEELDLRNVGCAITTFADCPIPVDPGPRGYKLIRIPQPLYLGKPAGPVPENPDIRNPVGGHIMLTSGTTGARKKVLISEASLSIRTARQSGIYGISEKSLVNIFDFAMWTGAGYKLPIGIWREGGAVVFHQDDDPHLSLHVPGITHAIITPVRLLDVLKGPADELRRNPDMILSAAGAALTRALADTAREILTPHIYSSIASTEVGIWGLTRIDRAEDLQSHQIHPSIEVQVVDESDQPLPPGKVGAVRVRAADGVTGYLDDEATSRQIFRQGYFYPGDLGEFRPDGRLVLHGRASSVITVRGSKFVAEPIEQSLQEKLAADAVCIVTLAGRSVDEVVHVVIQSSGGIAMGEAESFVKSHLPEAIPYRLHVVEKIPRNDMGKIDRISIRRQLSAIQEGTTA